MYRRTREEMPAVPEEIEAAIHEGVDIQFLVAPVAIYAANGHLESVGMQRMQLGAPDASGRRFPRPVPDSNFSLRADTVLTAIGEDPELDFALSELARSGGKISVNDKQETGTEFIYAGGDAAGSAGGTVAYAIGSGRRAAEAIHRQLTGETTESSGQRIIGPDLVRPVYFQRSGQIALPARDIRSLVGDFEEIHLGLYETDARQEAGRCMRCGFCTSCNNCVIFCPDNSVHFIAGTNHYQIDLQHCKGCGICAEECPRGSILMIEEGRAEREPQGKSAR
jgi:formate dehydrogenase major subunit